MLCFLEYCKTVVKKPLWQSKLHHVLLYLPALIVVAVLCTTPLTHFVFEITDLGFYKRVPTFFIQYLPYIYLLSAAIIGIIGYRRGETIKEKIASLVLALFGASSDNIRINSAVYAAEYS